MTRSINDMNSSELYEECLRLREILSKRKEREEKLIQALRTFKNSLTIEQIYESLNLEPLK